MTAPEVSQKDSTNKQTKLIASILDIYQSLDTQESLSPSPAINVLFSKLVALSIQTIENEEAHRVLNHPEVRKILPRLREICSKGEYELEMSWAQKIVEGKTEEEVTKSLHSFPYYQNYIDLTRLELNSLLSIISTPQNIVFIGSGPLPLSSFCMATTLDPLGITSTKPAVQIHNIDLSFPAISLSSQIAQKLGRSARALTFENVDINNVKDLSAFDVVFLAGLVGCTEEQKRGVIGGVVGKMKAGSILALRSVHSLRRLLYQEVNIKMQELPRLEILMVVHPYNHVVNSIVITRVKDTLEDS